MPVDQKDIRPGLMFFHVGFTEPQYYELVEEARASGDPWIKIIRDGAAAECKRRREARSLEDKQKGAK